MILEILLSSQTLPTLMSLNISLLIIIQKYRSADYLRASRTIGHIFEWNFFFQSLKFILPINFMSLTEVMWCTNNC